MKFHMIMSLRVLITLLATLCSFAVKATAEVRVALVVGNGAYEHVAALPNPTNDSIQIGRKLEQIGFQVTQAEDLTFDGFRRALRDFSKVANGADMALIYFAGHGIEIRKHNYLIPIDARLATDRDVDYEAISLDMLMGAVADAKGLKMVLLDACRDNPFAAKMKTTGTQRSIGRGLSRVEPTTGTLVSYAAKEGTTAADGTGAHSPYTKALLRYLDEPGLEVAFLFRKVRDAVVEDTNGEQEPFMYGSLSSRQVFLVPPPAIEATDVGSTNPVPPPPSSTTQQQTDRITRTTAELATEEWRFWDSVRSSGNSELIDEYLSKYPDGRYAGIARKMLDAMKPAPAPQQRIEPAAIDIEDAVEDKAYSDSFEQLDNYDAFGNDIRRYNRISLAKCEAFCRDRNDCDAYTYNKRYRVCFLKSGTRFVIPNSSAFTGSRIPNLQRRTMQAYDNADFQGGDYQSLRGMDMIECYEICESSSQCAGFSYVYKNKSCWLKSYVGGVQTKRGVSLFIK